MFAVQSGELSIGGALFGFIASALPAALLAFFLQLPIWAVLHLVRVPDRMGSPIAGAVAGAAYAVVLWALSNHPMPEVPTLGRHVYVLIGAIVGAVSGYVCWRVAKEDVG